MNAQGTTKFLVRHHARLASAPIVALITAQGGPGTLGRHRDQRAFHRAVQDGSISVFAADQLAIAAGHHPAQVWGADAWIAASTESGDIGGDR